MAQTRLTNEASGVRGPGYGVHPRSTALAAGEQGIRQIERHSLACQDVAARVISERLFP